MTGMDSQVDWADTGRMTTERNLGHGYAMSSFRRLTPMNGGEHTLGDTMSTKHTYVIPTLDAYRAASATEKRAMRKAAKAEQERIVMDDSLTPEAARSAFRAIAEAVASWTPEAATATVDWTDLRAVRGASLIAAGMAILSGSVRPDGMPDDVTAEPIGWAPDAIGVWADEATVARYASESLRRGTRHNLTAAIVATVADAKSGTEWTFTELGHAVEAAHPDYGKVSSGACRNAVADGRVPALRFVEKTAKSPAKAVRK